MSCPRDVHETDNVRDRIHTREMRYPGSLVQRWTLFCLRQVSELMWPAAQKTYRYTGLAFASEHRLGAYGGTHGDLVRKLQVA